MKYIISRNDFPDLQAKIKYFLSQNYKNKYYKKLKSKIMSYLSLCSDYYVLNLTLKVLIKKYFKGVKKTFYNWSKKILEAYKTNCFSDLNLKYCAPKKIYYRYDLQLREKICDYYYGYRNITAGGALALFHDIKNGVHGKKLQSQSPKNLLTFYRWIRKDKRWKEYKQAIKKKKRDFKRYEVSEIGLLQMDAKILKAKYFPVTKNMYVYDFIDEKTRIVFGYAYDCQSVNNAVNAVQRAIIDFNKIGIKIKRIRTDNGLEFLSSYQQNFKNKIKERPFTTFLNSVGIAHQTTPIHSPQSNGKIERFHQHYSKLFYFYNKKFKLDISLLQNYLNDYYYFYNFQRCHKSINFNTPVQFLNKIKINVDKF